MIPVLTLSLTISLLFRRMEEHFILMHELLISTEGSLHNENLDNILMPGLSNWTTRKFRKNVGHLLHTQEDTQSFMLRVNHTS